jgi:hypothetical protein
MAACAAAPCHARAVRVEWLTDTLVAKAACRAFAPLDRSPVRQPSVGCGETGEGELNRRARRLCAVYV